MIKDKKMALVNGCIIADDIQPCYNDANKAWLRNSRHVDGVSITPDYMNYDNIETIIWFVDFSDLM